MKSSSNPLPISNLFLSRNKIDPKPQYQRGSVWTLEKKQLLMDSILRSYDIPKFYLREIEHSKYEYEVVDGQQRLRAIWEYMENKYPLGDYSKEIDGLPDQEGKHWQDLTVEIQNIINSFSLSITELRKCTEIEVRDLFLRLQEGTTLSPPEKRNAMIGNMRDFVCELAKYKIFLKTTVKNDRFQYADYAAHVVLVEISNRGSNVKANDLKKMYQKEVKFNPASKDAKKIKKVLNIMDKAFNEITPELRIKWGFVDLYSLISDIEEEYVIQKKDNNFKDFYIEFENRRNQIDDPTELIESDDQWNRDLYDYIGAFQRDGANKKNLEIRFEVYKKSYLNNNPELVAKDKNRLFNKDERIVLWRIANMKCLTCSKKIELSEMHADHIDPHSKGGDTKISNGQCLCSSCNQKKKDKKI